MEAGYDVLTVDAPNFGYSSRETSKTDLIDREEVIHALMKDIGGKWIVGGHSMGGGIAINIATDYSEDVVGLVLYAPQTNTQAKGISAKMSKTCLRNTQAGLIYVRFFGSFTSIGVIKGFWNRSTKCSHFTRNA